MNARVLTERLAFLQDIVAREVALLLGTDGRLFVEPMTVARAASLAQDALLAERVDAFVARFGRLQDTLGDKLLPALLVWLGEPAGPVIDNLAKAERWGWLSSADDWLQLRQLRQLHNRMVQEYVRDPALLADALQSAHEGVPTLQACAGTMLREMARRTAA